MRHVLLVSLLLLPVGPALAQTPASPGPDDGVASPFCDIINFAFCPQPARPAPPFPDPEGDIETAARRSGVQQPPPAPALPRRHHRKPAGERS